MTGRGAFGLAARNVVERAGDAAVFGSPACEYPRHRNASGVIRVGGNVRICDVSGVVGVDGLRQGGRGTEDG